jgi:hypothetical protein
MLWREKKAKREGRDKPVKMPEVSLQDTHMAAAAAAEAAKKKLLEAKRCYELSSNLNARAYWRGKVSEYSKLFTQESCRQYRRPSR